MLLRIAWRNVWRRKRRSAITIGAMAFGVAMCMGFICVADGMFARLANEAGLAGDLHHEALALLGLGRARRRAGRLPEARDVLHTARKIRRRTLERLGQTMPGAKGTLRRRSAVTRSHNDRARRCILRQSPAENDRLPVFEVPAHGDGGR